MDRYRDHLPTKHSRNIHHEQASHDVIVAVVVLVGSSRVYHHECASHSVIRMTRVAEYEAGNGFVLFGFDFARSVIFVSCC